MSVATDSDNDCGGVFEFATSLMSVAVSIAFILVFENLMRLYTQIDSSHCGNGEVA